MKILLTGAYGFIGSNLIPHLKKEFPQIEFFLLTRKKQGSNNEILWSEFPASVPDDIYAVIHLAGLAHDTKKSLDDKAYYEVNFGLSKILYDWFLTSRATKFVYTSSVKAAADSVDNVLTEDIAPKPVTAYGKSKLKAEDYITQLSLGITGKKYYILRPCMVHGPGNKGNLNLLYKFVEKGLPYPLAAFDNKRSFLSIDNFCYVCSQILKGDIESGIYNMADDEPMSTNDLFRLIADAIGKKAKVWSISPSIIKGFAKLGDIAKLPVNTERLEKLTENYVVSNQKIKRALKIKCMPVSANDGLRKTIKSFKSQ